MTKSNDAPLAFDPVAFALALVGGPLLVTLVTCWLFIPIFALAFGGPVYLVIGTPVLLWMIGRYPPEAWRFALAGFVANAALCALIAAADALIPAAKASGFGETISFAVFGLVFGPLWAGTFAPIYRRFNRMQRSTPLS